MGWYLNQLQVGSGEFYGQNDTFLRVGWRGRYDGEEQETVGLPLERGVLLTKEVTATTTPAAQATALKVFLKTLLATTTPVATILSRINAKVITATTTPVASYTRSITRRITRTVAVGLSRSKQIAKLIRGKSGPKKGDGSIPTFQSVDEAHAISGSGSSSINYPPGLQAGDIMVIGVAWTDAIDNPPPPYATPPDASWNTLLIAPYGNPAAADPVHMVWWKRLNGSETPNSSIGLIDLTSATSLGVAFYWGVTIRGCEPDLDPIEGARAANTGSSNPQLSPVVTTTGPNRLILAVFCVHNNQRTATPNGTAVEQFEITTPNGNDGALAIYTQEAATAGDHQISRTPSASDSHNTIALALKPTQPGGSGSGQNAIDEVFGVASINKRHDQALTADSTTSSTLSRVVSKIIGRTVDVDATLSALFDGGAIDQVIDATAQASASIRRTTAKLLNRTADAAASIARQISKPITAGAEAEATIDRSTLKRITRTANATVSIVMVTAKRLLAQAPGAATIRRVTAKTISIATEPVALVVPVRTFIRSFTATSNTVATIRRATTRTLTAAANTAASLQRVASLFRTLTALAPGSASIRRTTSKSLTALATGSATIRRATTKQLTAIANTAVSLGHVFRGYVPSLRRIIAGIEVRVITPAREALRRIIAALEDREIETTAEDRRIVARGEPQRRIIAPFEPDREGQPGEENRRITPPEDL